MTSTLEGGDNSLDCSPELQMSVLDKEFSPPSMMLHVSAGKSESEVEKLGNTKDLSELNMSALNPDLSPPSSVLQVHPINSDLLEKQVMSSNEQPSSPNHSHDDFSTMGEFSNIPSFEEFNMANSIDNAALKNYEDARIKIEMDDDNMYIQNTEKDCPLQSEIERKLYEMNNFTCADCGKTFNSYSKYVLHVKLHLTVDMYERPETDFQSQKRYQCPDCPKSFNHPTGLKSHMLVHSTEKPYTCGICSKTFLRSGGLRDHLKIHIGERAHVCEICGKRYPSTSKLKVHMRTHSGDRPYVCPSCGKGFVESSKLKRHLRIHTGEQPYGCEVCGKRFNVISNLNNHMKIHLGQKPHVCSLCGKSFSQKSNLKSHIRIHTGDKDPYKCDTCGIRFEQKLQVAAHACSGEEKFRRRLERVPIEESEDKMDKDNNHDSSIHENDDLEISENVNNNEDMAIDCKGDNSTQSSSENTSKQISSDDSVLATADTIKIEPMSSEALLEQNTDDWSISSEKIDNVDNSLVKDNKKSLMNGNDIYKPLAFIEEFPCEKCDKVFYSRRRKKDHMANVHGEKPFVCRICGRSFRTEGGPYGLTVHKRTHSGIRPFPCNLCDKSFISSIYLKNHMQVHSPVKRFSCKVCDKGYSQNVNLEQHMAKAHGIVLENDLNRCDVCHKRFKNSYSLKNHKCKVAKKKDNDTHRDVSIGVKQDSNESADTEKGVAKCRRSGRERKQRTFENFQVELPDSKGEQSTWSKKKSTKRGITNPSNKKISTESNSEFSTYEKFQKYAEHVIDKALGAEMTELNSEQFFESGSSNCIEQEGEYTVIVKTEPVDYD